jgi:hypothetical protein
MRLADHITLVAAADWWEILIGIIFFVLYGLGQLMGAGKQGKEKVPRRPARPARPQQPLAGQPHVAGAPPNQADPLRAEVEEFLRRAQGKKAERPRPVQPQAAAPPPRKLPPRRPMPQAAKPPAQPVREPLRPAVRTLVPEPMELRLEGVAEHVARHVTTQDIAEQSSKLGADVALADDRLESRLHETFEHEVGRLEHREQEMAKKAPQTIAEEIRQLVRQPAGMRQLIIAHEILRRPEERW